MKSWALQQAIYSRLNGFTALKAIASAVYDHAPQNAVFPYVVIGEDTTTPFDNHSATGSQHTITIHSWSRYRGKSEIKRIQDQIYAALHRYALVVTGATLVDCQQEYADSFVDEDGLTRHGVTRVRVTLDG